MKANEMLGVLADIVGDDNVLAPPETSCRYFRGAPRDALPAAVLPGSRDELQDLVILARERGIKIFTVRSRYVPGSLAGREGVLVDLSRMDAVIDIDRRNLKARVQAGVTFERLSEELAKQGMRVLYPLSSASDSVLRCYLDRDVLLGSSGLRSDNLSVFKAVLGNGEIWGAGTIQLGSEGRPDFGEDQGPQLSGALRASEDIYAIPFEGTVYTYPVYESRELFLAGFEKRSDAFRFVRFVARNEHCFECLAADPAYLESIVEDSAKAGGGLDSRLFPPWTVAVSVEHHESLVDQWRKMLPQEIEEHGGEMLEGSLTRAVEEALGSPIYRWRYDGVLGDSHIVGYHCYPREAGQLFDRVSSALDIESPPAGRVVTPVYFGGAFHCETVLFCSPQDFGTVGELAMRAYQEVLDCGGLVDKPTGRLAWRMFERADEGYLRLLKYLKSIWDPDSVLNPDALLKGV